MTHKAEVEAVEEEVVEATVAKNRARQKRSDGTEEPKNGSRFDFNCTRD